MEAIVEDATLDGLVAAVDDRRADGLSVAAACRAVGVSTSTYYRRRRSPAAQPRRALAQAARAPSPGWPFATHTPRAPYFWDQVFADELSDSFVRREFGAGAAKTRPGRALSSLAAHAPAMGAMRVRAERLAQRLAAGPLGAAGPPLLALALVAALGLTAGWMVSVAANPAAWIGPSQDVASLAAAAP